MFSAVLSFSIKHDKEKDVAMKQKYVLYMSLEERGTIHDVIK